MSKFVERDNGVVIGVFANLQPGYAEEELPDDHPDVVAFVNRADPLPPLTMRQFRLGLLGAGLLSSVEAAIAGLPQPQRDAALIEWEYATSVRRNHSLVTGLSASLGLTSEQIDALWQQAMTIED